MERLVRRGMLLVGALAIGCSNGSTPAGSLDMAGAQSMVGASCAKSGDCASGLCVPVGGGASACSAGCASAADCLAGWSCTQMAGHGVCTCTRMPETCNGKDDNCDGTVDEEPAASAGCAKTHGSGWSCQSGQCVCNSLCQGVCADYQNDPLNCGGCGNACMPDGVCKQGLCACATGRLLCVKSCVDPMTDSANCGGCQLACTGGKVCTGGACACPQSLTACNGRCVDTGADPLNCGACGKSCSLGNACLAGACQSVPAFQYVIDAMTLPMTRTDFAIDLNGDGRPDNQLGNIIAALAAQNFNAQMSVDTAIANGTTIELLSLVTSDPAEQNDQNAVTIAQQGLSMTMPDYTGMGHFTVDPMQAPALFHGVLQSGSYDSENPVTTTNPVRVTLALSLVAGNPVELPINGAHIQYDASPTQLVKGELQGSVKNSDVQAVLIPAVAALLNAQVQANPGSSQAMQILALFDTGNGMGGNCTNMDGTLGRPGDGVISPCEVADNALVQNILAPDVQIYDANGNYAPNPNNTKPDSLSLGIGFTAVSAKY